MDEETDLQHPTTLRRLFQLLGSALGESVEAVRNRLSPLLDGSDETIQRAMEIYADDPKRFRTTVDTERTIPDTVWNAFLDGSDPFSAVGSWNGLEGTDDRHAEGHQWFDESPPRADLHDLRVDVDRLQEENAALRQTLETLTGTDMMVLQELLRELQRRR